MHSGVTSDDEEVGRCISRAFALRYDSAMRLVLRPLLIVSLVLLVNMGRLNETQHHHRHHHRPKFVQKHHHQQQLIIQQLFLLHLMEMHMFQVKVLYKLFHW